MFRFALLLLLASHPVSAQIANVGPKPSASTRDIERLRSTVVPDLRRALSNVYGAGYTLPELKREYKLCKFDYLSLGTLGIGIRVVWNGAPAPNSPFIGLYLKRGSHFQRLYTGDGFGPEVIKGRNVPDLVVGTTAGVCTEALTRLRFNGSSYEPDACIRHVQKSSGGCAAVKCSDNLPTFSDPYPPQ